MQDVTTRTCRRCKVERPLDDFYIEAEKRAAARRNRTKVSELHCRYCAQALTLARRAPRQAIVDAAKREAGCMDCGLRPDVLQVLEFDHREDEEKSFDVSDRITSGNLEDLRREIGKCDIVCANCHRIRTVTRNQFGARRTAWLTYGTPRMRIPLVGALSTCTNPDSFSTTRNIGPTLVLTGWAWGLFCVPLLLVV